MNPQELGKKYDKIAAWWHKKHQHSNYGLAQLEKAILMCEKKDSALDVGCGSGGRMINRLLQEGFKIEGIDVSEEMLKIASNTHPAVTFHHADICTWNSEKQYDLIVAWDSIFHLPFDMQATVVTKLCSLLNDNGILLYTFGDAYGDHESEWQNDNFYYSSIGINENLKLLMANYCQCLHLELDQYPDKHVYVIARKTRSQQV